MPIPQPQPDETKDDFLQRCMADGTMLLDFPDPSQRYAICEQHWNLDNTQIFRDTNDNYRPHKGKSKGKIDGIMATINAVWAMLEHDKENPNYDIGNIISFI